MTPFEIVLGIAVLAGVGFSIILQMKKSAPIADGRDNAKEMARLEKDLESAKDKLSKNEGAGKQMFIELQQVKAKLESTEKERDQLKSSVTKFETKREQQEKEHMRTIEKIESAERALKEERQRVIHDDEERMKEVDAERDRLWNDHEVSVISTLTDLCKQPHLQFTSFFNNNLPDDFDGSLKPDFLIDFLGQYVVFDAKVSKAQSLQTYIDDQVKKTSDKMKKSDKIYPHIFLVVPTEAIGELKKLVYAKDQYYFYIVSRESLAPILASLKRISTYELAETLDPQKRENIINMLADMATQINFSNATSLLTTKMGADVLSRMQATDPEIAAEVEQKSREKKLSQHSPSELKKLAGSLTEQNMAIQQLASPKASVKRSMIDSAQTVISQKLL